MKVKTNYTFLVLAVLAFCLYTAGVNAQSNWSAVLPTKFPTNASGQIHGISRVSQMKFHPSNPNKMYAVSARGGLFITSDGGTNWTVTPGTDFMPYARLASVVWILPMIRFYTWEQVITIIIIAVREFGNRQTVV
ncbi:MAG: hypothetical protein IPJ66_17565 [Bacteroidetes bacterium]|nr:hypothetical protein [Bacteroidota bacterium]